MAERDESSLALICAICVAVMLVVYPLSAGPMVGLFARLGHPEWMSPVFAVYSPLEPLGLLPGFDKIWESYIMWWYEVVGGRSP